MFVYVKDDQIVALSSEKLEGVAFDQEIEVEDGCKVEFVDGEIKKYYHFDDPGFFIPPTEKEVEQAMLEKKKRDQEDEKKLEARNKIDKDFNSKFEAELKKKKINTDKVYAMSNEDRSKITDPIYNSLKGAK